MEDCNELELSLALPCGGSSGVSKDKSSSSSDVKIDESDRGKKLIDDFKNFLHGGTPGQDSIMRSHRIDPPKPQDNFFSDLSRTAVEVDNDTKLNKVEEDMRGDGGSKRKNVFSEINHQKKHEKQKTSHISITTDEGSTAENEDVADSEADGSSSRQSSHHEDGSTRYNGIGVSDLNGMNFQGQIQNRFTISSEKDFKLGKMPYSVPYHTQSVMMNVPYSAPLQESHAINFPSTSNYALPGMVNVMGAGSSERSGNVQPMMPVNMPMMFGYPSIQLPVLDKDNSRGLGSQSHQHFPLSTDRGLSNSDKQSDGLKMPQVSVMQHKPPEIALEQAKGDGKQHSREEGPSFQTIDNAKGNNNNGNNNAVYVEKDPLDQSKNDGLPSEYPSIRPGFATDLKFGGCGSFPDLPWVSTKGPGPNGKTISGVTYRYSPTQILIVCACHSSHMSPDEFVRHASEEQTNPDGGGGSGSPLLPNTAPAQT